MSEKEDRAGVVAPPGLLVGQPERPTAARSLARDAYAERCICCRRVLWAGEDKVCGRCGNGINRDLGYGRAFGVGR